MTLPVVSITDGAATTVNQLVGEPYAIPARILERLDNAFLTDTVFRDAGTNTNGLVTFEESTPLFLGADVEEVAEFGEIPVGAGQRGLPRIAIGTKQGLGVRVSKEMRDENRMDDVNRQITQLTNTMIRAEERAFRQMTLNPRIPSIAAVGEWGTSLSKVRRDLANAREVVESAKPEGAAVDDEDVLGFEPNTIIFPGAITNTLMDDEEFLKVYSDGLADENILYTGRLPGQVMGLVPLKSRFWFGNRALVLQRKTIGFRSTTRPLQVTPLYGEGGGPNGGPTETWRSDATRKRVLGVDQPKAACWITGITAP